MRRRILITSVGSLVGQNILDCLEGRRTGLFLIGSNSLVEASGNFRCDRTYFIPPVSDRIACKTQLLEIMRIEQVDLAIPGRDDDILLLAELGQEHPEIAGHVLVGQPEMAAMMDDKLLSHAFAEANGLPFVATAASDNTTELLAMRRRYGFPLIAKPRAGNGSRGIRILLDDSQLARLAGQSGFAVQPMIDPPPDLSLDLSNGLPFFWGITDSRLFGVQGFVDQTGQIKIGIGFIATMVAGRCERMVRCDDPALLGAASLFVARTAAAGWRGPINMQFKHDPMAGYLAIELNGRFSGGTSARAHLGSDEVAESLNTWLGPDTVPQLPIHPTSRAVSKSLTDFPLQDADCTELETRGLWTRSS